MILPTLSGNLIAYDPIVAPGFSSPCKTKRSVYPGAAGTPSEPHDSSGK